MNHKLRGQTVIWPMDKIEKIQNYSDYILPECVID